jgi:hypothetical protein
MISSTPPPITTEYLQAILDPYFSKYSARMSLLIRRFLFLTANNYSSNLLEALEKWAGRIDPLNPEEFYYKLPAIPREIIARLIHVDHVPMLRYIYMHNGLMRFSTLFGYPAIAYLHETKWAPEGPRIQRQIELVLRILCPNEESEIKLDRALIKNTLQTDQEGNLYHYLSFETMPSSSEGVLQDDRLLLNPNTREAQTSTLVNFKDANPSLKWVGRAWETGIEKIRNPVSERPLCIRSVFHQPLKDQGHPLPNNSLDQEFFPARWNEQYVASLRSLDPEEGRNGNWSNLMNTVHMLRGVLHEYSNESPINTSKITADYITRLRHKLRIATSLPHELIHLMSMYLYPTIDLLSDLFFVLSPPTESSLATYWDLPRAPSNAMMGAAPVRTRQVFEEMTQPIMYFNTSESDKDRAGPMQNETRGLAILYTITEKFKTDSFHGEASLACFAILNDELYYEERRCAIGILRTSPTTRVNIPTLTIAQRIGNGLATSFIFHKRYKPSLDQAIAIVSQIASGISNGVFRLTDFRNLDPLFRHYI